MKTWQLVVVQIWTLCFVPAWVFMLIFAPLLLTPKPAWPAFILLACPMLIALVCSIVMWVARQKQNINLQKIMVAILAVFPVVSVIFPLFILK